MNHIKCPKCGAVFQADDRDYTAILEQVRTEIFQQELAQREQALQENFNLKEKEIKSETETKINQLLFQKGQELSELQNTITALKAEIENHEALKKSALAEQDKNLSETHTAEIAKKDQEINKLQSLLNDKESEKKIALLEASKKNDEQLNLNKQEILKLKTNLELKEQAALNRENDLKNAYEQQLTVLKDEIKYYKENKLKLSVKLLGETLEQHCLNLFNSLRSNGSYLSATFDKDNTAVDGTKGDFIFRDFIGGTEYVSIMFEMKNESDTSTTKHKNDDFLDKLHKDRTKKKCEYAVLVSMLEKDNELYDAGIVDKSYAYEKMYVIRPQFFIPVIRIISQTSKTRFEEKQQLLQRIENQSQQESELNKLQNKINVFHDQWKKTVEGGHAKIDSAINNIDKTIANLERQIKTLRDIKDDFEDAKKKYADSQKLVEDKLTVKKLTYGLSEVKKMPEVKAMLENEKKAQSESE